MIRALKRCVRIAAAMLLLAVAILILPPSSGSWARKIHVYTGIPYLGRLPKDYTGEWVVYLNQGRTVLSYHNGERHGVQRYYDWTGTLRYSCEFSHGRPWSGLCELWDFWAFKPWLAVYREGKVWTGALSEFDGEQVGYVRKHYYEGKDVNEAEFRRLMGFSGEGSLFGVHRVVAKKAE